MPARSIVNFARSASVVLLVALAVRADDPPATACGFSGEESLSDVTTFEPMVLGEDAWDGLYLQPFVHGFGGPCEDCAQKAVADDWRGFLGEVPDWDRVLRKASAADLAVLHAFAVGKARTPPKGYEKVPAGPRIAAALAYAQVLRDDEPYTTLGDKPTATPPSDLLARIKRGMTETKEPFLVQRYAFLAVRALFYARKWKDAVAFFDANAAALAGPSVDLRWRARYYVAGALAKDGLRGRANLELARITSGYQPLAGGAAGDFQPIEEKDWQATLGLARTVREKTELWRLVGIKADGIVAIEKILELDPRSNLVALLLMRELTRAESTFEETGNDPATAASQKKTLLRIETLATRIATTPGADRIWLAELVVGHIAAKRGDLIAARIHLQKAVSLAPNNPAVATQAKASLALALVLDWKIDAAHEEELAHLMLEVDPKFSRLAVVRGKVRGKLAKAYAIANRLVDSEFLSSGAGNWTDVEFIKQMLARTGQTATAFDRFVIGGITKQQLQNELFGRYILLGDFIDAQKALTKKPESLAVDPFLIHIRDCHDCDHDAYKTDVWNDATFVARLVELQKTAAGKSEAAAQAALALGNALYNVTWYGNARTVLESTRQATRDTRPAERWYKRAFDLTKNRELKTKAAFMAAKAELGRLVETESMSDNLPIPTTWFPVLRGLADTKYYKEVLSECGNFRRWVAKKP